MRFLSYNQVMALLHWIERSWLKHHDPCGPPLITDYVTSRDYEAPE